MSSNLSFQKLDNNRAAVAIALNSNQNKINELYQRRDLLDANNSELWNRLFWRKEYDDKLMLICGWMLNRCLHFRRWVNKIRRKMIHRSINKLRNRTEVLKKKDIECFGQECRALRRPVLAKMKYS